MTMNSPLNLVSCLCSFPKVQINRLWYVYSQMLTKVYYHGRSTSMYGKFICMCSSYLHFIYTLKENSIYACMLCVEQIYFFYADIFLGWQ